MSKQDSKANVHISLPRELHNRLGIAAKSRGVSRTAIIEEALQEKFKSKEVDPKRLENIKKVLERRFLVPRGHAPLSFLNNLYSNAAAYPTASAKHYWGEMVYLSSIDKTHQQVFTEVKEEIARESGER